MMLAKSLQSAAGNAAGEANYIEDVFSTWLYTGNGSTQTITNGIDLAGKGGLVWIKSRSSAVSHLLTDSGQGISKRLSSNSTAAAQLNFEFTSWNSNGFSLDAGQGFANTNAVTYASWTFRKAPKFFDVVTWTGDGTGNGRRLAHNLGSVPGCMIFKRTNTTGNWGVWHRTFSNPTDDYLNLNLTNAVASFSNNWGTSAPTDTDFPAGFANGSGDTYVAYLFAHNAGGFGESGEDNVISCGSIVASGGANDINLGFEAQFILLKKSNGIDDWYIYDTMRGMPVNNSGAPALEPNLSAAEANQLSVWPTATGFATNGLSGTYIYIAIRRGPMKVPESGTSVFEPDLSPNSNNPRFVSGFPVDMAMSRLRTSDGVEGMDITSRLTHLQYMRTGSTNAEATSSTIRMDYMNGFDNDGDTSPNWVAHMFRRAPGFMDVCCYTGTGVARTVAHNLAAVPELMIVKARTGPVERSWGVYSSGTGNSKLLQLNSTAAASVDSAVYFNSTDPTSSVFTVGTNSLFNGSGYTYVAYLFASCPGVSKVGSYTGTGTTQQINCGFTGGARFVLIKRTDASGDWYVWDSARGIVAGNDPYLLLNSTAAEVTSTDYIDTYSAGFEISSTAPAAINASGGTFIFLAIA